MKKRLDEKIKKAKRIVLIILILISIPFILFFLENSIQNKENINVISSESESSLGSVGLFSADAPLAQTGACNNVPEFIPSTIQGYDFIMKLIATSTSTSLKVTGIAGYNTEVSVLTFEAIGNIDVQVIGEPKFTVAPGGSGEIKFRVTTKSSFNTADGADNGELILRILKKYTPASAGSVPMKDCDSYVKIKIVAKSCAKPARAKTQQLGQECGREYKKVSKNDVGIQITSLIYSGAVYQLSKDNGDCADCLVCKGNSLEIGIGPVSSMTEFENLNKILPSIEKIKIFINSPGVCVVGNNLQTCTDSNGKTGICDIKSDNPFVYRCLTGKCSSNADCPGAVTGRFCPSMVNNLIQPPKNNPDTFVYLGRSKLSFNCVAEKCQPSFYAGMTAYCSSSTKCSCYSYSSTLNSLNCGCNSPAK